MKGHHQWSMHSKYEFSISYNSKVVKQVKEDNRQTEGQTIRIQANSENCGPPPGNNFDLEVGQGHGMVPNERACHRDYACQISMLYH